MTDITQLHDIIAARDNTKLASVASRNPEPAPVVNIQGENLVNLLFKQLKIVFPASYATIFKDPDTEPKAKRQWIAAFAENGITKIEQLQTGMSKARQSTSPHWPSPGMFIGWCRSSDVSSHPDLPSLNELLAEFHRYCRDRGLYDDAIAYPWAKPVNYWIVPDLHQEMQARSLSNHDIQNLAAKRLVRWEKTLFSGGSVPTAVLTTRRSVLPQLQQPGEMGKRLAADMLARICRRSVRGCRGSRGITDNHP